MADAQQQDNDCAVFMYLLGFVTGHVRTLTRWTTIKHEFNGRQHLLFWNINLNLYIYIYIYIGFLAHNNNYNADNIYIITLCECR